MTAREHGIVTEGLAKTFSSPDGDVHAVRRVDLEVAPGEIVGLLGPNGAGKTTTLRMLATLLSPTSGEGWVGGASIEHDSANVRRQIGFQTGSTGVYERLTPIEMMQLFGQLNGMDDATIAARVKTLVADFQMEEFADRLCGQLSTGQKQKTSIARTVIHDPPVLIFDEPLAGLDVMVSRVVLDFLRSAREAGKAVILSTHRLPLAEAMCDRVAIIYSGRIVASGVPAELNAEIDCASLEEAFFAFAERDDAQAEVGA